MARLRDTPDAEQHSNMWEQLNRPRTDGPARSVNPDAPEPAAREAKDDEPSPAAVAMAQLDPQHLLLVGAALFVVVTFFALRGLAGSAGSEPLAPLDAAASTASVPSALAAVDEARVEEAPVETAVPTTVLEPEPMAMGLPAGLLDSAQSQVFRLYRTALGREPDRAGFMFWSDQIREGSSLERLAEEFLASEEYLQQFGASAAWDDRADQLLANALGFDVDPVELDALREGFRGLDGAALLLAISEADETLDATGTLR